MQPIILLVSALLVSTPVLAQSQAQQPLPAAPATNLDGANAAAVNEDRPNAPAGSSTATTNGGVIEHLHFSLFTNLKGPNVTRLGAAETVNADGNVNPRQRMYFDSEVMAAYKVGASQGVGVIMPFWLVTTKGMEFSLGDMGVKFYDKKAYADKDLTVSLNLALQAPTNEFSRLAGMKLGVKTTPSIRYNIPRSRFTLGAWTEAKAYLGVQNGKLFKLWGAPYVSYQIAPKLSGILQFEYEASHFTNSAPLVFRTVQHDILTGVSYLFSPNLMVNPYVAFYTTERLSMDHAALGAIITASI